LGCDAAAQAAPRDLFARSCVQDHRKAVVSCKSPSGQITPFPFRLFHGLRSENVERGEAVEDGVADSWLGSAPLEILGGER
jgi:hypothetical protein